MRGGSGCLQARTVAAQAHDRAVATAALLRYHSGEGDAPPGAAGPLNQQPLGAPQPGDAGPSAQQPAGNDQV